MNRVIGIGLLTAVMACGSSHAATLTTTSATAYAAPTPGPATSHRQEARMPFEMPSKLPSEEPGPVNPRTERDLDIADLRALEQDRTISSAIVHAISNDSTLSPRAKHIDVTTRARHVTLRGTVPSSQERQEIDAKARFTTDVLDVDDQMTFVP